MYEVAKLLFIKALTPLHVGIGRAEGYHVDLPIQRDEFSYPTIWASSLKGAVKTYLLDKDVKKYLGSEPEERETRPSSISILDARLIFIPARTIESIWTYVTTHHLLGYLQRYTNVYNEINRSSQATLNLDAVTSINKILSSKFANKILLNEVELSVEKRDKLLEETGLDKTLPADIYNSIKTQGLVVVPEISNLGLSIINRSILVQYRVRLKREEKTVDTGPWSEEYVPMETVFVSLVLCSKYLEKRGEEICSELEKNIDGRAIYVGGKETIGRGLLRLYVR